MAVGARPAVHKGTIPISDQEIATVATKAGWGGSSLVTAVAVAIAEHAGHPHVDSVSFTHDLGVWQINWYSHVATNEMFNAEALLSDPEYNARSAYTVWQNAPGSGDLGSFTPWSTYRAGLYLLYEPRARKAIDAIGTSAQSTGGNLASGISDTVTNIGVGLKDFLGKLSDVHTWVRVGAVIGGAILLIMALLVFTKDIAAPAIAKVTA